MRDLPLDVRPVRAHHPPARHVGIVDRQLHPLADQRLGERHERGFAEVIGSWLEAESEQADASLTRPQHHVDSAFHLLPIALQDRREDRRFHVELPRLVHQRPQIFRQARAPEGKAGLQIIRR